MSGVFVSERSATKTSLNRHNIALTLVYVFASLLPYVCIKSFKAFR